MKFHGFECVKTKSEIQVLMQTQSSGSEQKYFTTFQTIRRVTGEEGVSGESLENILTSSVTLFQFLRLYRGLYTPLCTVALTNAVTFGVYGIMSRNLGNNTIGDIARNGSVAGFIRVINQKFIALSAKPYIIMSRLLL